MGEFCQCNDGMCARCADETMAGGFVNHPLAPKPVVAHKTPSEVRNEALALKALAAAMRAAVLAEMATRFVWMPTDFPLGYAERDSKL